MSRFDRIYEMHKILSSARYPVPMARILEETECSLATAKRIIRDMKNYFHAPIVWDRKLGGYHYQSTNGVGPKFELPGLWMSAAEISAATRFFASDLGQRRVAIFVQERGVEDRKSVV